MKKVSHNPFAFTPLPVTIITSLVYSALIIALLITHLVVPSAPSKADALAVTNITEAWHDLQTLTRGFHPFNSRRNDEVRNWLLLRIQATLERNDVGYTTNGFPGIARTTPVAQDTAPVVVFNDMTSDISFGSARSSVYFESTNIVVYIRGSNDDEGNWWDSDKDLIGQGGVLVNAHYDSVSTGYGATDDGVGVVTILQLIKFFTAPGRKPKRGIVALFNNGEEDFLNGANVFTQHPTSRFCRTFLNLEGAGAGGRATLFRSTDTEVTRFYKGAKYPFGTVLSADGFKKGLIRSETDYSVFQKVLGLRGLDVAFMEPRARYHTEQDDTRHTSIDSLWHMISTALSTTVGLASDTSSLFEGGVPGDGKIPTGRGSDGVWFDLFGRAFAVFQLRTLFALSVTLLVVCPLALIALQVALYKAGKLYLFSSSLRQDSEAHDIVPLNGWHGFFRYPIIFIGASGGVVGLAFLVNKVNPCIVSSSQYAVWSMMLSAWVFVAWFLAKAADFVRPTAFQRAYALFWMFLGAWAVLVAVTVLEHRLQVAGFYFMVFYFAAVFLATAVAWLEMFRLPRKSEYASAIGVHERRPASSASLSSARLGPSADERLRESAEPEDQQDEDANESTSLLHASRSTFAHYTSPSQNAGSHEVDEIDDSKKRRVFGEEQAWSWSLPTWTWLIQFVLFAPIVVVLVGQIGLLILSALHQTVADGNSPLLIYILLAVFSTLILAPLGPFLHRYTYHIPTFLLLVFVGTLIYNLVAFPFSSNNRLKLYFIQRVDLDTSMNKASLTGVGGNYLNEAIKSIPSVAGQKVECADSSGRLGLTTCAWSGIPPRVVQNSHPEVPPQFGYQDWLSFNATRIEGRNEAQFQLWGRNTRACKLLFNTPITDFKVEGASESDHLQRVPEGGSRDLRLWSRTWEQLWNVTVKWDVTEDGAAGLDGQVVCLWSDDNETGVIPALEEIRQFVPSWVAITKFSDGLVEGSKAFIV
ncbi:hypothetical protein MMC20_003857 [Loxospora ochrophaea]|nr:hypothetical protein [Loxospora ochrophaea]